MKIIFDFDNTLFSAKKFVENLIEEFKKIGVDEKLFSETFQESKDELGYNPERQFELISKEGIDRKELEGRFEKVIRRAREFLYPDVLPTLENLKKENELILLTYGNENIQRRKIDNTGIATYFTKIIITSKVEKVSEIRKLEGKLIFVEDNPNALIEVKKSIPNVITVRINREEGKYASQESGKGIDYEIRSLQELEKIVS